MGGTAPLRRDRALAAVAALALAWLLLVGLNPRAIRGRGGFQELDLTLTFGSMAKQVFVVGSASELPGVLNAAARLAISGRAGPVVVGLPEDVLAEHGTERSPTSPVEPFRTKTRREKSPGRSSKWATNFRPPLRRTGAALLRSKSVKVPPTSTVCVRAQNA